MQIIAVLHPALSLPVLFYTLTWVERGIVTINCLAQEHNNVPGPGSNQDRLLRRPAH